MNMLLFHRPRPECSDHASPPSHGPSRRPAGFTLVEMLIVVILIAILAGLTLGLIRIVGIWSAKAKTHENLGKLRAAVEEFYAEYGKYPPVPVYGGKQPTGYEYVFSNGMNNAALACFNVSGYVDDGQQPIYVFGLLSFLVRRGGDEWGNMPGKHAMNILNYPGGNVFFTFPQWTMYNAGKPSGSPPGPYAPGDQQRDIDAIQHWKVYIKDIQSVHFPEHSCYMSGTKLATTYTNICYTVQDGWGNELIYESQSPYQVYKLYSVGPDGKANTDDDIVTGPGY